MKLTINQRTKQLLFTSLAAAGITTAAHAAIITVNTVDNKDFSAGKMNLWQAIQTANTNGQPANVIRFNIEGSGPHYIVTPPLYVSGGLPALGGGYPIITNHNLAIEGYSQPGALANTNTILGSNTAVIKIVIDSRAFRYTPDADHPLAVGAETMNYALITGKTYGNPANGWAGFTESDAAQIGIFNATNVTIKGLCFLNDYYPGMNELDVVSVALAGDYPADKVPINGNGTMWYPNYNLQISGCWFNLLPDGTTVVDGGYNAVRVQRHRAISGNGYPAGRWSPSGITVGVAKHSENPRAEFNIIMSQAQGCAQQGERNRWSGNFFNVLADGLTQYFPEPQRYPGSPTGVTIPTEAFIGGNYAGYNVIGTDGDGINDAEERNIFAGLPRKRANGCAQINHQCGCYNVKVAGNYFGLAVDGITRWTNSSSPFRFSNRPDNPTNCVFGTEFDGVSDDLEANVIANNWPLDYWFEYPETEPDVNAYYAHQLAPMYQYGAPPETLNTDAETGQMGHSFRGNKLINNFTAPMSPFASSRDRSNEPWYWPSYSNSIVSTAFTPVNGTSYEGATNFITVVDPTSTTKLLKGIFPLGKAPFTNVVIDVYVANEEGLTNGTKFQTLTNVLPVWAQGDKVLAYNLLADKAGDLDPAPGAFSFNIASLRIAAGTKVTVTASYAKAGVVGTYMAEMDTARFSLPVALLAPPDITITSIVSNGDGTVTITWTGGKAPWVVERCTALPAVPAAWSAVSTNVTASATIAVGSTAFIRVK
jgi:hypothetical protein